MHACQLQVNIIMTVLTPLTWHNVQWKWLTGTSVPICARNCGSITWANCTKAQGWNQAVLDVAHNFCSEFSSQIGRCMVISPNASFRQKTAVVWALHVKVTSSKGPKPVVMRWSERVLPWRPAIFERISKRNSSLLCHKCPTHLGHKCPTH